MLSATFCPVVASTRFTCAKAPVASEEDANALAQRVHGEAQPGGQVVWEVTPQNPFAVFGGLGG